MSSPARSSVSVASGGVVSVAEDVADSIDALYRKDEAVAGKTPPSLPRANPTDHALARLTDRLGRPCRAELKSEVMEALQKEVRSLDEDSWMFAAPRSRINLVSRPGKTTKVARHFSSNWLHYVHSFVICFLSSRICLWSN